MGLLGVNWHALAAQSVAIAAGGTTYTNIQHSLGTTPDLVLPLLSSVGGTYTPPVLLQVGGNASQATVGYASIAATMPIFSYNVWAIYVHSIIR